VGRMEEAFNCVVDWVPRRSEGKCVALCENGIYVSLQLHRCGHKELYHRQLYQDLVGNALPAGVEIHHRDGDPIIGPRTWRQCPYESIVFLYFLEKE